MRFMSIAIVSQWKQLDGTKAGLERIQSYLDEYLSLVYNQAVRSDLLKNFMEQDFLSSFYSGEFDALSYAFYRSAFETIAERHSQDGELLLHTRREFTKNVGRIFFASIQEYLHLDLPSALKTPPQFLQVQNSIALIGEFLIGQGYLREQCEFTFSVDVAQTDQHIFQATDDFLKNLNSKGIGYALYIMGYPAIFPSAVYLYQMFSEAQHHSSRKRMTLILQIFLQIELWNYGW